MQMRMVEQILSPGMKHGEETDFGAEVLGVGGNPQQGFRGGSEENAVDDALVLKRESGNLGGHSKDHMEIRDRKQFRLAVLDPIDAS
jgi:hypothetical protein